MTSTETERNVEQYAERAQGRLAELQEQARQVSADHRDLIDAAVGTYSSSAKVVFTGAIIWERIQVCCSSTPAVQFTSDIWGLSVAFGGIVWGTIWSAVPFDQLPGLGSLTVQCNIRSVEVDMSWWQGSSCIATFVGGGVGIGAAVLGGSGSFKLGSC